MLSARGSVDEKWHKTSKLFLLILIILIILFIILIIIFSFASHVFLKLCVFFVAFPFPCWITVAQCWVTLPDIVRFLRETKGRIVGASVPDQ